MSEPRATDPGNKPKEMSIEVRTRPPRTSPEFDRAASTYDRTRRPPSKIELDAVLDALGGPGSVLDVATGTGRYALPLRDAGHEVTGLDLSRPMLEVARRKGLDRLIQANAYRLPFPDRAFDSSTAILVLQAVPDPVAMLREMGRVARKRVVAILPPDPEERRKRTLGPFDEAWGRYFEEAGKRGFAMKFSPQNLDSRAKVLKECPPTHLQRVEDWGAFWPEDMTWEDVRDFSGLFDVPPEVHAEIVKELGTLPRPSPPDRPRSIEVVRWDAEALRTH